MLFDLLVLIALIGFFTWAVVAIVPMPGKIAQTLEIVALIVVIWIVLGAFGLLPQDVPVPSLR
jgi:hypothetical protein